jgi:hypothetical protein
MFRLRKARKPKAQIDADWLLGPSPEPARAPRSRRGARSLVAVGILVAIVPMVAWNWESWSQSALRWQWERLLASEDTDEDTLAALVSIGESINGSTVLLIQQLQSGHPTRRAMAFQLLKARCEPPNFQKLDADQRQVVVEALDRLQSTDAEVRMMRGWVAARIMSQCTSNDPSFVRLRNKLMPLVEESSELALAPTAEKPKEPTPTIATKPATPALPEIAVPLVSVQSTAGSNASRIRANPLRDPDDSRPVDTHSRSEMIDSSREPTRIRLGTQASIKTIAVTKSPSSNSMSLSDRDESSTLPVNQGPAPPRMAEWSTEQLLRSLEHAPDDEVTQAIVVLEERGFTESHIEWAMDMARGTAEQRLAAMERILQDPKIHPVPWLVWMAESGDRDTKLRAIAMLGATADTEAVRRLRLIEQRESDPRVSAQIQQALRVTEAVHAKGRSSLRR